MKKPGACADCANYLFRNGAHAHICVWFCNKKISRASRLDRQIIAIWVKALPANHPESYSLKRRNRSGPILLHKTTMIGFIGEFDARSNDSLKIIQNVGICARWTLQARSFDVTICLDVCWIASRACDVTLRLPLRERAFFLDHQVEPCSMAEVVNFRFQSHFFHNSIHLSGNLRATNLKKSVFLTLNNISGVRF